MHEFWILAGIDSIEILAYREFKLISFLLVMSSYNLSILLINGAVLAILSFIKHFSLFSFYSLFSLLT